MDGKERPEFLMPSDTMDPMVSTYPVKNGTKAILFFGGLAYLPYHFMPNCQNVTQCLNDMWPQDPHVIKTSDDILEIAHKLNGKTLIIPCFFSFSLLYM